ncbi:MAG: KDO2-lipid IV(A) lauroyltransferase [Myxococcota bacterium]|jgi:KDO2-lipid IV(A) lauroyltransferase
MSIRQWPRKLRQRFKHRPGVIAYMLYIPPKIILFLMSLLPYWVLRPIASSLGLLALAFERRRRVGRAQLLCAFPELTQTERDKILRESCKSIAMSAVEAMILTQRYQPRWQEHLIFADGARELIDAQKAKGAIFVQSHFGSFEFAGAVLGKLGLEPAFPMRFPNNYYLGRDLIKARKEGWQVEIVSRKGAIRSLLRRLKAGNAIVIATDQSAHHNPIFVPWFGKLAATERATASLALKLGSPVLTLWAVRHATKPLWTIDCALVSEATTPRAASDENVYNLCSDIHASLEQQIKLVPEQYLWIHDRYRIRPESENKND